MIPEIDETTITAYALNELNAQDRARVELQLAQDPIARQTVADIQATAALLTSELAQELQSAPALAIPPLVIPRRRRWVTAAMALAAAAALAAGLGLYVHQLNKPHILATTAGIVTQPTRTFPAAHSGPSLAMTADALKPAAPNAVLTSGAASTEQGAIVAFNKNPFVGTQHDNLFTGTNAGTNSPAALDDPQIMPSSQATGFYEQHGLMLQKLPAAGKTATAQTGNRTLLYSPTLATKNSVSGNAAPIDDNDEVLLPRAYDTRQSDLDTSVGGVAKSAYASAGNASTLNDNVVTGNVSGLNYYHGNGHPIPNQSNDYSTKPGTTDTETYSSIADNPFLSSRRAPLSTFAVDVDTASYSNVRRFIEQGQLPPADAVRIQDLINYFPYSTVGPKPTDADPVAVNVEVADCPWQPAHRLARIALKAKSLADQKRPPSNLVFLLDVSGSMADENKLPLLKQAIKKLVNRLTPTDRVSIVTYAGNAKMTLETTPCSDEPIDKAPANDDKYKDAVARLWTDVYEPQLIAKHGQPINLEEVKAAFDKEVAALPHTRTTGRQQILDAVDSLNADGETNGGDGIQLAYRTAVAGFIKEGVNRVILATDGDFNVGIVDPTQLTALIDKQASTGVYLTVLGVGMGNVKDATMEKLANHGKGNYAYLDSLDEADKVLGKQINATLVTVAKDVKLQVEFNPATVAAYRLIGYEDRAMPNRDFNNDQKTAGEMGAGHSVTALYELIPANGVDAQQLKYQPAATPSTNPANHELMTVSVRYQPPSGGESGKLEVPVTDQPEASANASSDFRFTAAVASFGMILRNSPYRGNSTFDQVIDQATAARGEDVGGYRSQFIELVKRAKSLSGK